MNPNVYIDDARELPWKPNPEEDDDEVLETTSPEVVQILGFDPKDLIEEDGLVK